MVSSASVRTRYGTLLGDSASDATLPCCKEDLLSDLEAEEIEEDTEAVETVGRSKSVSSTHSSGCA